MELNQKILSDLTVFMKYAKYLPEKQRRETWEELVDRNKEMHLKKFPELTDEIENAYKLVYDKKILPSMRSLQFAGKSIEINPSRIYNCCYLPIDDWRSFPEVIFLLLGGTGVGYSVQKHHIEKLPDILKPRTGRHRRWLVNDSIEGWADSVKILMKSYFQSGPKIQFDFSDIRPKGARLITSGGKAPGPQPLKECLVKIEGILDAKQNGEKLTSIEVHDIICHLADAVLAGGIRRAALISLFNADDDEMISCKSGNWWELNPQRGRANNSAVLLRHKITKEYFLDLWKRIELSNAGEPGIYLSNDKDWGTNPSLRKGTLVLTSNGIFPIEQLQDTEFEVKNITGNISKAKCWLSGTNKQLFKITLQGGHEYYSTDVHEWPIWDGDKFVKIQTDKIKVGSYLPNLTQNELYNSSTHGSYLDGLTIGWNLGDGWITKTSTGKNQYGFIFSKKDMINGADVIINYINKISEPSGFKTIAKPNKYGNVEINISNKFIDTFFKSFGINHKSDGFSDIIWQNTTEDFKRGLIDGLFSSDGSYSNNRVGIKSKYKKLSSDIAALLGFYGIKTSIKQKISSGTRFPNGKVYDKTYETYSLRIMGRKSIEHFRELFKSVLIYKQEQLDNQFKNVKRYDNLIDRRHDLIKILNIEKTDLYEDVWDISVFDETHCFQIAHCITGNCCEIALRPNQFCNLCEVNVSDVTDQDDLNNRVKAAAFIGTLQASYTDFHYLRPIWQRTTEKDALIGISMTGIASNTINTLDLIYPAELVKAENERVAKLIGINKAARTTCIKPAGTTSLTLGTSSGIHAWHNDFYIRRIRVGKNESIYTYLSIYHPELIEDEYFRPHDTAVISIPQKSPKGSILRNERALELLERIKYYSLNWVKPGHRTGQNTHNVSATVSIKPDEWDHVGEWMWENRDSYNGLSVLPHDNGTYIQAPFEDITEEKYNELIKKLHEIDLTKVIELNDETALQGELACAGGVCEIK